MSQFERQLAEFRQRSNQRLAQHFEQLEPDAGELKAAMRYAVINGGKRVRPVLTYATGMALSLPFERLDAAATAIEMVHAYSLVHDDLPAMDNDELRRGLPTCHIRFGEATAILAGDALQAYAFELLSTPIDAVPAHRQLALIQMIAKASGQQGMAYGQAIDLAALGQTLSLEQLEFMHQHKTGALIQAAVLAACYCHDNVPDALQQQLEQYAIAIGLAFQIVDDILDVTADTDTLGKTQGSDIARDKPTYPSILGLDGARFHADKTLQNALDALSGLPADFDILRAIARYIVNRSH